MTFISNIGWISRNSSSFNFEILNHGYLFNIPISEISELLEGKKHQIMFYIPLKGIYGKSTLSSSGGMIFFDIDEKRFGTPVKLLNAVFIGGMKKPLSEIDNRPHIDHPSNSIYESIISCLTTGSTKTLNQILDDLEPSTIALIKMYHGDNSVQLDYDDPKLQAAYMLCYFPAYIGNIYNLLNHIECDTFDLAFKNNMRVSFYGCGPAPDFLGYLAFLNKKYPSKIDQIEAFFFDKHDWNYWRQNCIDEFSKLFAPHIKTIPKPLEIDLLKCDDAAYLSQKIVQGTDLHIFQNCITDIYGQCKSYHKMGSIFENICDQMHPGSIVILIDFLGKGDSMTIMNTIKKRIEKNPKIVFLDSKYNVDEYTPNFQKNPLLVTYINRCYEKAKFKPRNITGYTYLIVQRTD